uniref:CRISPR-associated endoribonuclease Cas2 n=1 Tax=Candidatus Endomicrobium sp. MdMp-027 TaxID=1837116 RepID=A0A1C9ZT84_9BACT|nr:CRISPR-associated protein cas2 [Candidatus Endomicrobium sp. MdMp-027]
MLVLISYDINTVDKGGARRLRNVSKTCLDYGQRVQFSVFECEVDPSQWIFLKDKLLDIIDSKKDSIRFYILGSNWKGKIEHYGCKEPVDLHSTLIV